MRICNVASRNRRNCHSGCTGYSLRCRISDNYRPKLERFGGAVERRGATWSSSIESSVGIACINYSVSENWSDEFTRSCQSWHNNWSKNAIDRYCIPSLQSHPDICEPNNTCSCLSLITGNSWYTHTCATGVDKG